MNRRAALSGLLVALLLVPACSRAAPSKALVKAAAPAEGRRENGAMADRFGERISGLGFDLLREAEPDQRGNVLVSPLSLSTTLGMVLAGAKGETRETLAAGLGVAELDSSVVDQSFANLITGLQPTSTTYDLVMANSLWGQRDIEFSKDFLDRDRRFFGAEVRTLDFTDTRAAAAAIDRWARKATRGKVGAPAEPQPEDLLHIVNAVYFKATWADEFVKEATEDRPFRLQRGSARVPTMERRGFMPYAEIDGAQVVALDYLECPLTMYVALPDEAQDVDEYLQSLDTSSFAEMRSALTESAAPGELRLPRFEITGGGSLKAPLSAAGLGPAFSNDADYSGMSEASPPFLADVAQETWIRVDEQGTEGAAVTEAIMAGSAAPSEGAPFVMHVDRPFVFMVADSGTGAVLFAGVVRDPRGGR